MIKKIYNPRHIDLYVALFSLSVLGIILGLGYGFMEYEREYTDPCSIEPIVDTDAITFFEEHKDMPTEQLKEKFSEAKEHAIRLTGKIMEIDEEDGEYLHLEGSTTEPSHNIINCALRKNMTINTYTKGDKITVQCYCKGKTETIIEDDANEVDLFAEAYGNSTELILYKCCVQ